jgi:hypothetical protein
MAAPAAAQAFGLPLSGQGRALRPETLVEILQFAAQDCDGNCGALRFFERLWQSDQVVFDTSRAAANHRDRGKER